MRSLAYFKDFWILFVIYSWNCPCIASVCCLFTDWHNIKIQGNKSITNRNVSIPYQLYLLIKNASFLKMNLFKIQKLFLIWEVPAGLPKSIQHCTRHYWHFLKKLSIACFISISIYTLLTNQGNMIKSKIIKTWKYPCLFFPLKVVSISLLSIHVLLLWIYVFCFLSSFLFSPFSFYLC